MELPVNKEPKNKVDVAVIWIWFCFAVMAVIINMRGNKSNKWLPELPKDSIVTVVFLTLVQIS